jgi:hypothetical protein
MRTSPTAPASSVCARHPERPAATLCDDCAVTICEPCTIEVPELGRFCWGCAAARGGLRHGARAPHHSPRPRHVVDLPVLEEAERAARRFQESVAERRPHSLISGLSDRLAQAGADPEHVLDDTELFEDIARLQDQAAVPTARNGRWRRR